MDRAVTSPTGQADAAAAVSPSATPTAATVPDRSVADRRMRRLIGLDPDGPKQKIIDTEGVFGKSIAISAIRCLFTYIFLPLLAPIVDLSGAAGPILGLALGAVSMVAIVISVRRFFAADHKWRWYYAAVAGAIFVALIVAGIKDTADLLAAT